MIEHSIQCGDTFSKFFTFIACAVASAVTPTTNFILAITIAWFFNVWCGMRADGVINIRCSNFSWKKFLRAMLEFLAFLLVVETIALVTTTMGDAEAGFYACKTASYCITYIYIDNGLKNLAKAYPKSKGMWCLYLFFHFDLKRLFRIDELMNKYEEHIEKIKNNESK